MAEQIGKYWQAKVAKGTRAASIYRMRALSLLAVAALILATGCSGFFVYPGSTGSGGGGGTSATGDYVYVANSAAPNLAGFAVGTGTLAPVTGSPYVLAAQPTALAINPANSILYVAAGTGIYAYGIQSTGALTALNGGSAVATGLVAAMDISPDGQWLIALNTVSAGAGSIGVYQINSTTGGLTAQATPFSVAGTSPTANAIKVTPNAQFVFAAMGSSGTLVFPFNTTTGVLSAPTPFLPPTGTSDNAFAVDSTSTYLYIARSGTGGGLVVDKINGGTLAAVAGSPFAASSQPASEKSVLLNKAGTAVYIANYKDGTISGFSIGSGGVLMALAGSPYSAGSQVIALSLDNSGNYLLSAAQGGSPDLSLFSFDTATTGKLDAAASAATGTDPTQPIAIAATH